MSECKYSVSEIDQMRRSVELLMWDVFSSSNRHGSTVAVEERLRTYMQNGTGPEELAIAAEKHTSEQLQRRESQQELQRIMAERIAEEDGQANQPSH